MDQLGVRGIFFHLLAQSQDVHIHGAVGDGAVLPPYGVEQLVPAEDHTLAAHHEFQEPKLGGGEPKQVAIQLGAATAPVELDRPYLYHARWFGGRSELQLDADDQLPHEERLDHIIARSQLEADDTVGLRTARRQKNHRDVRQLLMVANPLANVETVGIRKHDVEQNQVRSEGAAQVDGALAGLRARHLEAFFFQIVLQQRVEIRIVFDKDNLLHGA